MMIEAVLAANGFAEAAEWIDQPHVFRELKDIADRARKQAVGLSTEQIEYGRSMGLCEERTFVRPNAGRKPHRDLPAAIDPNDTPGTTRLARRWAEKLGLGR
jgi:hypothetical protein